MGPAKFAQLQAVLEMARRSLGEEMRRGIGFSSPAAVRDYLRLHLAVCSMRCSSRCGWMRRIA
jgi:DNA repair protein RadC